MTTSAAPSVTSMIIFHIGFSLRVSLVSILVVSHIGGYEVNRQIMPRTIKLLPGIVNHDCVKFAVRALRKDLRMGS